MPATTVTYNEGSWEPIEKNPIESKRERLSRREGQRKGIYICITILKVNEVNALAILPATFLAADSSKVFLCVLVCVCVLEENERPTARGNTRGEGLSRHQTRLFLERKREEIT